MPFLNFFAGALLGKQSEFENNLFWGAILVLLAIFLGWNFIKVTLQRSSDCPAWGRWHPTAQSPGWISPGISLCPASPQHPLCLGVFWGAVPSSKTNLILSVVSTSHCESTRLTRKSISDNDNEAMTKQWLWTPSWNKLWGMGCIKLMSVFLL